MRAPGMLVSTTAAARCECHVIKTNYVISCVTLLQQPVTERSRDRRCFSCPGDLTSYLLPLSLPLTVVKTVSCADVLIETRSL